MKADTAIRLLSDAGPLITLAYADALDMPFKPGWSVQVVANQPRRYLPFFFLR